MGSTMSDLRERIAVTLQQEAANGRASYWDMADAVLAALGHRLVPDTDPFEVVSVEAEGTFSGGIRYVALLQEQIADDDFNEREGTGLTIAAAIRDALESQP